MGLKVRVMYASVVPQSHR